MMAGRMLTKSVIISGATSAIARACAEEFAGRNYDLILLARNDEECSKTAADLRIRFGISAECHKFDAQDTRSHASLIDSIRKAHGNIAGILIVQGFMPDNDDESISPDEVEMVSKVNFESVVSLSASFLKGCSGREFIAAVSSIAGIRGKRRNLTYNAAKAAAIAYLQGLYQAALDRNVSVSDIRPGFIDTRMTAGMKLPLKASPESAAKGIVDGIIRRKKVIYVPFFWNYIMLIIRNLPGFIYDRMKF